LESEVLGRDTQSVRTVHSSPILWNTSNYF
jgi:hypothetical protein